MKYIYPYSRYLKNNELLERINNAAERLASKISAIKLTNNDISEYTRKYFTSHLENLTGSLRRYGFLISWALSKIKKPFSDTVIIDYGGGSGILSLLCKELGIGTVIYVDIFEDSCRDAEVIGNKIGSAADHYVEGDIDSLDEFLKAKHIKFDALVSYDVIEHIYDIEKFFSILSKLPHKHFSAVLASGANGRNPVLKRRLMKLHHKFEYISREPQKGHKERDSLNAYFETRKEIIVSNFNKLTSDEIHELSIRTRGLCEGDILRTVSNYQKSGSLPSPPNHPTNTCDPSTGNWAERIMETEYLKDFLQKQKLNVSVFPGYYSAASEKRIKRTAATFLNYSIKQLGISGLMIAPYYVIHAISKNSGVRP